MSLITLSVHHRLPVDEARQRMETAVRELTERFGAFVRQVEWSTDRSQVQVEGSGLWIEMRVDQQAVHLSADFLFLGRLFGGSLTTQLQAVLERTFQRHLPGNSEKTRGRQP